MTTKNAFIKDDDGNEVLPLTSLKNIIDIDTKTAEDLIGGKSVDTYSNQSIKGQKDFSQYPTINGQETLYPASSTGWLNSGLKFGKKIHNPNYEYRIDTIDGNPTMHIWCNFDVESDIDTLPWDDEGRVLFYIPGGVEAKLGAAYGKDAQNLFPAQTFAISQTFGNTTAPGIKIAAITPDQHLDRTFQIIQTIPLAKY